MANDASIPYLTAYGNITKTLEKIRAAQVPARFSQDFLATTLNLPGGGARPVIAFLKRTGFLGSDGTPTDRYRRFRNDAERGVAAAEALRSGYARLYEVNEYIHDASDAVLKGVVVQVTGAEPQSTVVKCVVGSFKALKAFATFDESADLGRQESGTGASGEGKPAEAGEIRGDTTVDGRRPPAGINLGYTINLNLPRPPRSPCSTQSSRACVNTCSDAGDDRPRRPQAIRDHEPANRARSRPCRARVRG